MQAQESMRSTGSAESPVSIVIPCRAEYVGLCRLLAGVVGGRNAMDAEQIADLKLVVTEACTCFLSESECDATEDSSDRVHPPPDSLRVDLSMGPEGWEVTVADSESRHQLSEDSKCLTLDSGNLGLTIMRALVDKVEHTVGENGGSVIRLSKGMGPRVKDQP